MATRRRFPATRRPTDVLSPWGKKGYDLALVPAIEDLDAPGVTVNTIAGALLLLGAHPRSVKYKRARPKANSYQSLYFLMVIAPLLVG